MSLPAKISKFLDIAKVKYEILEHKIVYTAFDKAATLRVNPKIIGKTLIVKMDREAAIALLAGNKNLDKLSLKKAINANRKKQGMKATKEIDFAKEAWMKKNFKGIKLGAIPPFGAVWKLQTFADKTLLKEPKIIINSGDYDSSIKITPANYKKIVPDLIVGSFSKPR